MAVVYGEALLGEILTDSFLDDLLEERSILSSYGGCFKRLNPNRLILCMFPLFLPFVSSFSGSNGEN